MQNVSSTADLEFVAAGDFNSDGAMALVIADGNYTKARVFMNRGGGDFGIDTAYDATGYPLSVATGDLNGDGWLDCVVCEYSNGRIGVRLNDGRGGIEVLLNTSE